MTTVPLQQIEMSDKKIFFREMTRLALFILPVAYLAVISAVIVHELIGHGLVAALLGGVFSGFGILVDGMGWAMIDLSTMEPTRMLLVLLGGAFFTNLFSAVFFMLSMRFRKYYLPSMTFLFFAFAFLMDGVPYFFWDAIYIGGIGDVSNILKIYPSEGLKSFIIVFTAFFGLAGIYFFNCFFYKRTVIRFAAKEKFQLTERLTIAVMIFAIQALGWISFDWKQLIPVPGIGAIPSVVPVLLTLAVLAGIVLREKRQGSEVTETKPIRWRLPIIFSWCACILLVLVIILWTQNGVVF